ncbi:hypothetical protein KKA47_00540 [bacterium]|nr:hypothetical protein [bacterium]
MKILRLISILLAMFLVTSTVYAKGYGSSRRKYTKSDRVYSIKDFDANLIWNVTYFSDGFRQAYSEQHAKINQLKPLEAARFYADQQREQAKTHEFFIGFYTRQEYKNFTDDRDSFWHIRIITEQGEEILPSSVGLVPIAPYERKMFPYLNRWSKAYKVTFPKAPLGEKFKLKLYSIIGESVLKFKK